MDIFKRITESESYKKYKGLFKNEGVRISLSGLVRSCSANIIYEIVSEMNEKAVYVASNSLNASKIADDLTFFSNNDGEDILILEPYEYMLYDVEVRSSDLSAKRVETLYKLLSGDWRIIVTTPAALAQWLPKPEYIRNSAVKLHEGDIIELDELIHIFSKNGYVRLSELDGKGQFAIRGDIVDIFPFNAENPVRIEFFDNEIDSIRIFDILSQRTVEKLKNILILPDNENMIWDWKHADIIRKHITQELEETVSNKSSYLYKRVTHDIEQVIPGGYFQGYDRYLPFILGNTYNLLDYTGKTHLFFENYTAFYENLNASREDFIKICDTIQDNSGILRSTYNLMMTPEQTEHICNIKSYNITYIDEFRAERDVCDTIEFSCRGSDPLGGNIQILLDTCEKLAEEKYDTAIITEGESKRARLMTLKEEKKLHKAVDIIASHKGLSSGYICDDIKLAIFTDESLFKKERAASKRKLKGKPITDFADIEPGDLVVHDVHGVGRFEKIESVEIDGIRKDYIKINYRDDGVLYVPTPQLDSVQKYIGPEGTVPKLNKLGSTEWNKTTSKVKESLRAYAKELVDLYARRSQIKGFAYSEDTVWQKEFEEAFPYEETDDQLRCTEEIKRDLENIRPMERLLCGDVGYGKTEVALRAAFKVVCDGRQVAFLVPTTVLAQQHYNNFVERFEKFPVRVDYLCRFRTPAEKKKIIADTASGKIDILIGTHSIIKGNVKFKNLGLVVIDEEQRFGVMHKEKLKQERPDVDILTLSATPIPRTLHMSLSGIRDISLLEDPPQNRHPVQTYVAEWEPTMIRNAIYREMGRKGQVFYLYNRVKNIEEKRRQISELIPEARIAVGHGQMGERELENIMEAFYKKEYDILLCTTIIESGLDMPNVNTVIIEESDHMGLAQLYQIRGRVGRSGKTAYAYITYKKDKTLSETAEKRLRTIRDFTEFGSGFKIALRDLEIRGAGSVLGEKQHGQLAIVGYDTYCRLLSEVINEAAGREPDEKIQVSVDFNVNGYIDPEYIENEEARFDIYKKISRVETENDALEITDELIDRYGAVPESVQNLIKISRLRYECSKCGINSVIQKKNAVQLMIDPSAKLFYASIKKRAGVKLVLTKEPYILYETEKKRELDAALELSREFAEQFFQFNHCKK